MFQKGRKLKYYSQFYAVLAHPCCNVYQHYLKNFLKWGIWKAEIWVWVALLPLTHSNNHKANPGLRTELFEGTAKSEGSSSCQAPCPAARRMARLQRCCLSAEQGVAVKGQHRASAGRHTALCWVWGWLYTSLHMFTPTELHVWSQTAVSAGDNLWNVKYMYLRFYIICLYIFEAVQVRVRKEFPDTEHLRREGVY